MGVVRTPSALSTSGVLLAALLASSAAAQDFSPESIEAYQAGMEAFQAGNLERAIELFRESYEVYHGHPNALYNIGQCYERLGDLEQAVNYYEQYLASDLAEGRDEVYARMRELRAREAVFTLRTIPAGAGVHVTDVNGLALPEIPDAATPCELELPPGTFVIHLDLAGYTPRTQVVEGGLGRRSVIEITLAAATTEPPIDEHPTPRGETGRVFLGPYGGVAVHLNGASDIFATVPFGIAGGYTLFDGDWRLDLGADVGAIPYQITDPGDGKDYLTWFLELAVVPAARWIVLPELHLLAQLGIGVGIYTPPSKKHLDVPWAGNEIDSALTIIHLRPALGLEYLPLSWLGIQAVPVALDVDIPYSSGATPTTSVLLRFDAFLGVSFHF
ncbi:MAG: tetratricopeptide repeat protein [Deltaproteobacteria bacterium]|nr:tetratricopeptide repeat protein [Deltaproteobacteria bacterium]